MTIIENSLNEDIRQESAGGLVVKALGQKLRDLGLSPSQHSPFPALNCPRENYLFIIFYILDNNGKVTEFSM